MGLMSNIKDSVLGFFSSKDSEEVVYDDGISFSKVKPNSEQVQTISTAEIEAYKYSNFNDEVDSALLRKGYKLYTKEMMSDDQIKACVMIKKLGVVVGGYSIQAPIGESEEGYEEAKEIAEFTDYCLKRMAGSVEKSLLNIAHAIVPGFSVLEIVWDIIPKGRFKGKIGIKELKMKPAPTFTFKMDEYGRLEHLIQNIEGQYINIPLEKVLLYTYDPQATGLPMGVSDLRAAYKHWWSKDALMRFRNIAADKFACPTVKGTYPSHFSKELQAKLLKACKSFATSCAFVIPEGANVELIEPKGSVVMPYEASIDSSNKGMARAIFGQILATDEGNTGSFAQAKIHRGILGMFLKGIRNEIAEEVFKEQLFKRLVAYNYDSEFVPNIVLNVPDERDLTEYANAIDKLINRGVVEKNEPFVRSLFGFPAKPKELIERDKEKEEQLDNQMNNQNPEGNIEIESAEDSKIEVKPDEQN